MSAGDIPPGWAWATLEDVAISERAAITDGPFGSNLKTEHYTDAGPRVVRLQNIGDGVFVDERAHISQEHFERLRKHEVMAGDVLVAMLGEELPRACVAPATLGPAIVKADCIRVRVDRELASSSYIMYALNCDQSRHIASAIVHGVGRPRLNLAELKSLRFPLAPRAQQDLIVAAIEQHLSDIDAGVAALERVLANLKRYRAAVLKAGCEGKLVRTEAELARKEGRMYEPTDVLLRRILDERRTRWEADQLAKMAAKGQVPRDDRWKAKYEEPKGPDTSELPELPEGWAWTCLGQVTNLVTSGSRGWGDRYADIGPLFIRAQDIKTDQLMLESVARVDLTGAEEGTRTRVKMGDLLVTITGANVTKTAKVVMDLEEAYVSQHVGLVRPVLTESTAFLHAWIVSPAQGRRHLERVAYGAGKPGLNLDNLRELPVAHPPLAEQYRIVAEIDRLLSVADETEQVVRAQLARAERLRKSVLKQAFEGKLVPQDSSDEPASELLARLKSAPAAPSTVLSLVPGPAPLTIGRAVQALRERLRLAPKAFASRFEVPVVTVPSLEAVPVPFDVQRMLAMRKAVREHVPSLGAGEVKLILDEVAAVLGPAEVDEPAIERAAARRLS